MPDRTQAWVLARYQSLVDGFRQRGWTDAPPLGDAGSLEAQNVLHAMWARLHGRRPLTITRGPGMQVDDAAERRKRILGPNGDPTRTG